MANRCSRYAVLIAAGLGFASQAPAAASAGFSCDIEVHGTLPSPSGRVTAVLFEKACGATTPFNRQVSIAPRVEGFSPDDYPPVFVVSGKREVFMQWFDDNSLRIEVPEGAEIFKKEISVGEIRIIYH